MLIVRIDTSFNNSSLINAYLFIKCRVKRLIAIIPTLEAGENNIFHTNVAEASKEPFSDLIESWLQKCFTAISVRFCLQIAGHTECRMEHQYGRIRNSGSCDLRSDLRHQRDK
jgi:hypothetical protein